MLCITTRGRLKALEESLCELQRTRQELEAARTDHHASTIDLLDHLHDERRAAAGLRRRLGEAESELRTLREGRERLLADAHNAGRLARTFALLEGAGMGCSRGTAEERLLAGARIYGWIDVPGWECQKPDCPESRRELVWHPDVPKRAHLVCACGQVWKAAPGAVERGDRETRDHQKRGTHHSHSRRWSLLPSPVLEAIDRALPAPAHTPYEDVD
ncbi:hypothetical protein [Nocardiopsis suaedae]|uniref:Uncharacterized protein n=1 Tax=Nocardiopsis suaedae TaxID=3018444 RepID=A0ABT4TJB0_9ACTN|nr:hypothetical protein [Nocardiopsis suaedae]MDA2804456.1 hypothetical protein [Nocardiopsis suaedae]